MHHDATCFLLYWSTLTYLNPTVLWPEISYAEAHLTGALDFIDICVSTLLSFVFSLLHIVLHNVFALQ